jgi:hypothetical protein
VDDQRAPLGVWEVRDAMNSRTGKSAVARCPLIMANKATATAAKVAFFDLSYLTSLHKRANFTTIFKIYSLDKAKRHVPDINTRLFGINSCF